MPCHVSVHKPWVHVIDNNIFSWIRVHHSLLDAGKSTPSNLGKWKWDFLGWVGEFNYKGMLNAYLIYI